MNKHRKKINWHFFDNMLLILGVPLVIILVLLAIRLHWYPFGP